MALPALATVSELASWMGTPIDDGDARAELLLESASGLVRSAAGLTWVDENDELTDVHPDARTITLTAAARAWANPSGASQTSTGPFSSSWPSTPMLTTEERATLTRLRTSTGGLYTIATTRTENGLPDRYLEVTGSELIPHVPIEDVNW